MRWPWQAKAAAPERRAGLAYTDAVTAAFETAAGGTSAIGQTAALEAAAGTYARGFAAARVQDAPPDVLEAVTPDVLAEIGRDLIRRGESVHLIEYGRAGLRLHRAGSWDWRGGWRRADWTVRLSVFGPSEQLTRIVPFDAVLHCRFATDPARPWHGIGPVAWASLSGTLHSGAVAALISRDSAASGYVLPMPPEEADDDDAGSLGGLKAVLAALKGKTAFVESTRGAFGGDVRDAPAQDWAQKRIGPEPDETLAGLHNVTAAAVLSACGVDPVLVGLTKGDGTLAREAFRRFDRLSLQPLARTVEGELRSKLDAPDLALNFDSLRASDFAGVARAYKSLVEAGLTPDAAAGQLDMET